MCDFKIYQSEFGDPFDWGPGKAAPKRITYIAKLQLIINCKVIFQIYNFS